MSLGNFKRHNHISTDVKPYSECDVCDHIHYKQLEQKLTETEATLKEAIEVIRWTNMVHDDGKRVRDFLAKIEGKNK